jgi:hypothetical protein
MATVISIEQDTGALFLFTVDAVPRIQPEHTANITDDPIESGAVINDHIIDMPDTLQLGIVISNTPHRAPLDNLDGAIPTVLPLGTAGAQTLQFVGGFDRASAIYEELLDAKSRGDTVDVFTSLRAYEGFAITRITPTRTAADGSSFVATIDFKQVNTVDSQIVDLPIPAETRGNRSRNRGKKNAEPDPTPEGSKSAAKKVVEFLQGVSPNA